MPTYSCLTYSATCCCVWRNSVFTKPSGRRTYLTSCIAQTWTEIQAARALVYNAARKKEAGQDFVMDAAMAKLYSSQVAGKVSSSAVEWMGGMGFVREGLAEKYFRDSKIGAIYEGTSNIQLTTIAKALQKQYTK